MVLQAFAQSFFIVFVAEMGDKSQMLMAALSARYPIRYILLGASLAILLLNLLAVSLGGLLGAYLPTWAVSIPAGIAFLWFSRGGEDDSGEEERACGTRRAVLSVFTTYFLAELGDKTQLATLGLSSLRGGSLGEVLAVLLGSSLGLLLSGALGLFAGRLLQKRLSGRLFRYASGGIFFLCGVIRLLSGFEALWVNSPRQRLYAVFSTASLASAFLIFRLFERSRHGKNDTSRYQSLSEQ